MFKTLYTVLKSGFHLLVAVANWLGWGGLNLVHTRFYEQQERLWCQKIRSKAREKYGRGLSGISSSNITDPMFPEIRFTLEFLLSFPSHNPL